MGDNNLFKKIFYKYEYIGDSNRSGEIRKKYRKVLRFRFLKKIKDYLIYLLLFLVVLAFANFLASFMVDVKSKAISSIRGQPM